MTNSWEFMVNSCSQTQRLISSNSHYINTSQNTKKQEQIFIGH